MNWLTLLVCFSMSVDDARLAECIARLEEREAGQVELCLRELRAEPDASLRLGLENWEQRGLFARRRLAEILAEVGEAELCPLANELTNDTDVAIRRSWLAFLMRRDHAGRLEEQRAAAISSLAQDDHDAELRLAALRALAGLGGAVAARELESHLYAAGQEERRLAAALLGGLPLGRDLVLAQVQLAFVDAEQSRLDTEVLALLLPSYGRALAEKSGAGGTVIERAPIVQGATHPAPHVRRGARLAFEAWSQRLRQFGVGSRAIRLLKQFAEDGFDPAIVLDNRLRIALSWGNKPLDAVAAARELQELAHPLRTVQDRELFARALYLEGLALIAADEQGGALAPLERSGDLLDQLLAERSDLTSKDREGGHGEALQLRAMIDLTIALLLLSDEAQPGDERVTKHMRAVHRASLELQVTDLNSGRGARDSLDSILGGGLSPLTLLFARTDGGGWSSSKSLKLHRDIGDALAVVAPRELPGFVAGSSPQPPVSDPVRLELLFSVHHALIDSIEEYIEQLRESPSDPLVRTRILQFRQRRLMLFRELREAQEEDEFRPLLNHRAPCSLGLWLMRDLRAEGRTGESRALAEAARAGLEDTGQYQDNTVLAAEIEIGIGTSWSDEDEPERAERELTKALERLDALQTTQEERGGNPRAIAAIRRMRSEALVSMAVNANVKLLDPERALDYFERAYELRQDEFMSVLLACYRARSGRATEARAALASVVPSPSLYYNLACTWALLGEHELALDYLRREFDENHVSVDSRNRQREWAENDPDLENLKGQPRFRALLTKE